MLVHEERRVYGNVLQAIGNTPLIRLNRIGGGQTRATLWAKAEFLNPGGSVKDRIGFFILEEAERRGELRPGMPVVEATSGNTGVGVAMAAALKGYRTIFVMPDKMSEEKVRLLRAFGAQVIITPTAVAPEDPRSYYSVAKRLVEELGAFYVNQYHNPDNPLAHYRTTGPEIWEQTEGRISVFVAGMGTGGTITGVGRYLKERKPDVQIVGVDPEGSVYYDYFHTGQLPQAHVYKVEGIGEDFLPSTVDFSVVDDVVQVSDREAFLTARRLIREEGLFVGGSSGAAVAGALRYLRAHPELTEEAQVVILLPDSGDRYLSKFLDDNWMREHGFLPRDTVAQLLERRPPDHRLLTAAPRETIREAVARMKAHDVSQLPVVEGGRLLGMVTENCLLTGLLTGQVSPETPVAEVLQRPVQTVTPATPLDQLADAFQAENAVVVVDDRGTPIDVLTKIDYIDYLSGRE